MTCERCDGPNTNTDSEVCNACWIALMQQPELPLTDDDWEERHPIDTIFDRDLERERDR